MTELVCRLALQFQPNIGGATVKKLLQHYGSAEAIFAEKDPLKDGPDGFLKYLNPDSLTVVQAYVEPALASAGPLERFQFERTGYFVADERDTRPGAPVFNRTCSLKDSYKP